MKVPYYLYRNIAYLIKNLSQTIYYHHLLKIVLKYSRYIRKNYQSGGNTVLQIDIRYKCIYQRMCLLLFVMSILQHISAPYCRKFINGVKKHAFVFQWNYILYLNRFYNILAAKINLELEFNVESDHRSATIALYKKSPANVKS